jgi:signal transduction histidine kinase
VRRLWRNPYALDALLAVGLGFWAQWMVWGGAVPGPRAYISPLFVLVGFPLLVRRRFPLAVLAALLLAVVGQAVLTQNAAEGSGLVLPLLVAIYSVAAWGSRRTAITGLALSLIALTVSIIEDQHVQTGEEIWAAAFFCLLAVAAWVSGLAVHARRDAAELEAHAADLERRHQEAIVAERDRIARELHDVIAHNVSVVVVQAVGALGVLDNQPARAREPLERIERSGREALAELRRLLGVMRGPGALDEQLGPQPGIADLEALVDGVRGAGVPVELTFEGPVTSLPKALELSVYRIVQEALTNTLKHAGPASASVIVSCNAQSVEVDVVDDGMGTNGQANGSGHGLMGMRERVALFGGRLQAGDRIGGFGVHASVPLEVEHQ